MRSLSHSRRSWFFSAAECVLPWVSEFLWGATPPFQSQSIAYLAAFVSMCENFLGCRPHWGLFKHIFTCRSQTVKKASPDDERTKVIQMCGGLGIQMRSKSAFPAMTLPESVRGWQSTWFYC